MKLRFCYSVVLSNPPVRILFRLLMGKNKQDASEEIEAEYHDKLANQLDSIVELKIASLNDEYR